LDYRCIIQQQYDLHEDPEKLNLLHDLCEEPEELRAWGGVVVKALRY
jgi:hypothetical protein